MGKGWPNHAWPMLTLSMTAFVIQLVRTESFWALKPVGKAAAIAGCFLMLKAAFLIQKAALLEDRTTLERTVAAVGGVGERPTIVSLAAQMQVAHPLSRLVGGDFVSRYPSAWAVYNADVLARNAADPEKRQRLEAIRDGLITEFAEEISCQETRHRALRRRSGPAFGGIDAAQREDRRRAEGLRGAPSGGRRDGVPARRRRAQNTGGRASMSALGSIGVEDRRGLRCPGCPPRPSSWRRLPRSPSFSVYYQQRLGHDQRYELADNRLRTDARRSKNSTSISSTPTPPSLHLALSSPPGGAGEISRHRAGDPGPRLDLSGGTGRADLRRADQCGGRGSPRAPALFAAAPVVYAMLVVFPGNAFSQREHIGMALFLPMLALIFWPGACVPRPKPAGSMDRLLLARRSGSRASAGEAALCPDDPRCRCSSPAGASAASSRCSPVEHWVIRADLRRFAAAYLAAVLHHLSGILQRRLLRCWPRPIMAHPTSTGPICPALTALRRFFLGLALWLYFRPTHRPRLNWP